MDRHALADDVDDLLLGCGRRINRPVARQLRISGLFALLVREEPRVVGDPVAVIPVQVGIGRAEVRPVPVRVEHVIRDERGQRRLVAVRLSGRGGIVLERPGARSRDELDARVAAVATPVPPLHAQEPDRAEEVTAVAAGVKPAVHRRDQADGLAAQRLDAEIVAVERAEAGRRDDLAVAQARIPEGGDLLRGLPVASEEPEVVLLVGRGVFDADRVRRGRSPRRA